jgi:hypothetical protein
MRSTDCREAATYSPRSSDVLFDCSGFNDSEPCLWLLQVLVHVQDVFRESQVQLHIGLMSGRSGKLTSAFWMLTYSPSIKLTDAFTSKRTLSIMRNSRSNRDSSELGRSTLSDMLFFLLYLHAWERFKLGYRCASCER